MNVFSLDSQLEFQSVAVFERASTGAVQHICTFPVDPGLNCFFLNRNQI